MSDKNRFDHNLVLLFIDEFDQLTSLDLSFFRYLLVVGVKLLILVLFSALSLELVGLSMAARRFSGSFWVRATDIIAASLIGAEAKPSTIWNMVDSDQLIAIDLYLFEIVYSTNHWYLYTCLDQLRVSWKTSRWLVSMEKWSSVSGKSSRWVLRNCESCRETRRPHSHAPSSIWQDHDRFNIIERRPVGKLKLDGTPKLEIQVTRENFWWTRERHRECEKGSCFFCSSHFGSNLHGRSREFLSFSLSL